MSRRTDASVGGGGRFATGTYVGNGGATQAIAGVGFQPKHVIIYATLDGTGNVSSPGLKADVDGLNALVLHTGSVIRYVPDMIISLDADGFTVGDGTGVANILNIAGRDYVYACWG